LCCHVPAGTQLGAWVCEGGVTSNSERGASFHFTLPKEVGSRRTSAQDDVRPLSA
jgi:hypothetical protein